MKIRNGLCPGGKTYTKVETIDAETFSRPEVLILNVIGSYSLNAVKTVAFIIWKGFRKLIGNERPVNDEDQDLHSVITHGEFIENKFT